ncbi:DUF1481 domain-containing protein [Arsenophonus apicola]|uniref:DUF1481 domain-containing protein n=1 Tax=Arsenophonus apicola TaxID=2879119 RepID=UPI003878FD9D
MPNRIFRGGIKPLLLIGRILILLGAASLLGACTNQAKIPEFSASGFISDAGVVRLWRLNDQNSNPQVIVAVYSPYQGKNTTITFFEYRQGKLWQIRHQSFDYKNKEQQQLRFDQNDHVIFMQRRVNDNKVSLTEDDIVRWRFESDRLIELSTTLIAGNVHLYQGYWREGQIITCSGEKRNISFTAQAENRLLQRAKTSNGDLAIAWLEAPAGNELLLVANEDFCLWAPTKDKL